MNKKILLKNLLSLSLAQLIIKIVNFIIIAYLARVLTRDGFGKINFALALVGYFSLLVNQGLDIYGTNKIAENDKNAIDTVNHILTIRLLLGGIYFFALCIAIYFIPNDLILLVVFYGLAAYINSFAIGWVFQALQKMSVIAFAQIINSLFYGGLLLVFVHAADDILLVSVAYLFAIIITVSFYIYKYVKKFSLPKISIQKNIFKDIMSISLPMGFSNIMIMIYLNLDLLIIPIYHDFEQVGLYSANVKIMGMIVLIYSLILQVFAPNFAKYFHQKEKLIKIMYYYQFLLISVAFPIGFIGTLMVRDILVIIFGPEYLSAASSFIILIWTKVFVALNMAFGNPLLAWKRQKAYMLVVTYGALINLIFNFLLIPNYGINGAAIATLIAEFAILWGAFRYYQSVIKTNLIANLKYPLIGSVGFILCLFLPDGNTSLTYFGVLISCMFYIFFMIFYSPLNLKQLKSLIT